MRGAPAGACTPRQHSGACPDHLRRVAVNLGERCPAAMPCAHLPQADLCHCAHVSWQNIPRDECEITLLGTGSSMPSKYRNVTGIHVNLFQRGGMMLDCGEDTYGQMVRRFGFDAARE